MTELQAIIMGIVQGLTEFLPVSSSGHLVLAEHFLRMELNPREAVSLNVLLHMGTLLAVLLYFRRDLLSLARGGWLLLRRPRQAWREEVFSRLAVLLIWISRRRHGARTVETITWKDALLIGVFQAAAVLPGISRSGATVTAALLCGLDREAAPRYSFLLSVPIMVAAGLYEMREAVALGGFSLPLVPLVAGFFASLLFGYFAVVVLLAVVRRGRLYGFSYYLVVLSVLVLGYWAFLLPKPAGGVIVGQVDEQRILVREHGELGPLAPGQAVRFSLTVRPGLVPVSDVYLLQSDGTVGQDGHPILQRTDFSRGDGAPLYISEALLLIPSADGAQQAMTEGVREIRVVIRNAWGIENVVRLRLLALATIVTGAGLPGASGDAQVVGRATR